MEHRTLVLTLSLLVAGNGALAAPASRAPELPGMDQVREALALVAAQTGRVWLSITRDSRKYVMEDGFLRVRLTAERRDEEFSVRGYADKDFVSFTVRPAFASRKDYTVTGADADLALVSVPAPERGNRDYRLDGWTREGKEPGLVHLTIRYSPDWRRYSIEGPGVSLHLDAAGRWELDGEIQYAQFGKKSLAALCGAAAAIIHNDGPREGGRQRP